MNRREFISLIAAAPALRAAAADVATPLPASLELTQEVLATMPADFGGLSYEATQLYNPDFFSAENTALVEACKGLGSKGVLRLGGNLSDRSRWKGQTSDFSTPRQEKAAGHDKTAAEWKLVDPRARASQDGAITAQALRRLRGFLEATGWSLIYGLNFGSGSAARAQDEAACVAQEIGRHLLAFQAGNEVDYYAGNPEFREPTYGFEQFYSGYREFVEAVRARVPRAPFAGPDVASNLDWIEQFGRRAGKDAVLLSGHYYAMGPAGDPGMNAARLLAEDPRLAQQIERVRRAAAESGLPFRMTEGNSCYGGGKPGVSDAYVSALWGADYMLRLAAAGYAGVNLHGGGLGHYSPIATPGDGEVELRPLYHGMRFAGRFAGYELLRCRLQTGAVLAAYAGRSGTRTQIALINKGAQELRVSLGTGLLERPPAQCWRLAGPALDAGQGVGFRPVESHRQGAFAVPAYSGLLLAWD